MTREPLQRPHRGRFWLFATAFTTGAVVMALEILGSRLLAPVFGNSLYVWGALIGVILAAMSTGYAMGGWLADRYPGGTVLSALLLGAGSWTMLLAWKGQPVMFAVSAWIQDPRWGPCLAASVLLAPPAFGLSGVLPALLRLSIADMGHLGRHTGAMIAVSTVGSLAGTWGTAFYLLSWLGSMTMVAVLGAVQLVLGLLWWWRGGAVRARTVVRAGSGLVLLAVALGLGWQAVHPDLVLPTPTYQEDSPYQQIRVREDDLLRYLILDRTFHAVMWRVDPVHLFLPYTQLMMAALAVPAEPKRVLVLGHGGGSITKWLARYWPQLQVDTVEVDPSVVRAAEAFFAYRPATGHRVFVQDARAFLRDTDLRYDVIWVDVLARHLIPFHLTTREFFAELRAHVGPDGVVAVNLASSSLQGDRLRAEAIVSTLRTAFPNLITFAVKGPWDSKTEAVNVLFFVGPGVPIMETPTFATRVQDLLAVRRLPQQVPRLLRERYARPWGHGLVLTDDFAPFDLLGGSWGSNPGASAGETE